MIYRRYGETVQSVDTNFDSRALNEIGFRRDGRQSHSREEFTRDFRRTDERELVAEAKGDVQDEVQAEMLRDLEGQLRALEEELGEGEVLVVENDAGDWPKARDLQKNVVVEGQNRLHFTSRVDPPLRIGVYRREG